MIFIDGTAGEGGGQILRSALGLSLATGKPFRIEGIRARRQKPGLMRQHLTAVKAAIEIGGAKASGAELSSQTLCFEPVKLEGVVKSFAIGSAGSACLVAQTVIPGLMMAAGNSELRIEGGTHNQGAPCFDFLKKSFLPSLKKAGAKLEIEIERHGFYPAGGGRITLSAEPAKCGRIEMLERGRLKEIRVKSLVALIPLSIANQEIEIARESLGKLDVELTWQAESVESNGPGNAMTAELIFEHCTEIASSFGERGLSGGAVAEDIVKEMKSFIESKACVGEHLADQLLIPMALGAGGKFTTCEPSSHTKTNIAVIRKFLDVEIVCEKLRDGLWTISVEK